MEATEHTILVGTFTVLGAYSQSTTGLPIIGKYIGKPLGSLTDIAIGGGGFILAHHIKKDMISDIGESYFLGYGLSGALSLIGL